MRTNRAWRWLDRGLMAASLMLGLLDLIMRIL